jgi:hypothetical protein
MEIYYSLNDLLWIYYAPQLVGPSYFPPHQTTPIEAYFHLI